MDRSVANVCTEVSIVCEGFGKCTSRSEYKLPTNVETHAHGKNVCRDL